MALGMPAFISVVPMNQSSIEKNGWSPQIAIRSLPGICPGQFDGCRCYVGTILGELHHVSAVDNFEHRFRKVHLDLRRPGEVSSELHLPVSGLNHRFKGVSEGDRP